MLLADTVLRLLTIKALRGRTWVGDRVFDSPAQPANLRFEQDRAAYIGVYTDDADLSLDGESFASANVTSFLTIEIAVADTTTVAAAAPNTDRDTSDPDIDRQPGETTLTHLAQTDEALELSIGLISRQVSQALLAPDNPWAELWRQMTIQRDKVEVRRGGPGMEYEGKPPAVRYASRILRMTVHLVGEPAYREGLAGAHPEEFWPRFFAAALPDEEIGEAAKIIRAHIVADPVLPSWRAEQIKGMLTAEAARAMGFTPPAQVMADEAEPYPLTQVMNEGEDIVYAPTVPPGGPTI